jgi:hypothetical protein
MCALVLDISQYLILLDSPTSINSYLFISYRFFNKTVPDDRIVIIFLLFFLFIDLLILQWSRSRYLFTINSLFILWVS